MCLIIFDWQPNENRVLTLASNRDEYYERPTQNAHFWQDSPNIFGGRDLRMKGSWLAISKQGKLAAVTNYRAPDSRDYERSRGEIPRDFLESNQSALDFANALPKDEYAGFNALLFDGESLAYCHNRGESLNNLLLEPGQYGLSNHLLNTPWPKVRKTKPALVRARKESDRERMAKGLLEALRNQERAPFDELPKTGISPDVEHMLSPPFISSPVYGTRTSSIITIEKLQDGQSLDTYFWERQYHESADKFDDLTHRLTLNLISK